MSIQKNLDPENLNMIIVPNRTSVINKAEPVRKMLHEEIEIKYFYEGKATLLIGTQTVTVQSGDIVVINPYEFHATVACPEEKGRYHLIMIPLDFFSGSGMEELELRSLLLAKGRSFKTLFRGNTRMEEIVLQIVNEYKEKGSAFRVAIRGLITELFAALLRDGIIEGVSHVHSSDILRSYQLIEPALKYIKYNYREIITTNSLAGICNISKYYFCRTFKNVTKKTAMEYLSDYRISISDIMLCNTDKSISEISEQCGFGDANYFCRCYKKHYGVPPSIRRKNI